MKKFVIGLLAMSLCIALIDAQGSPLCSVYEIPRPCGKLCEPTCAKPQKIFCTPADKDHCPNQCRCIDDYVRHNGKCIPVSSCPCS